jgi:peptide/nickel transport system permease protein
MLKARKRMYCLVAEAKGLTERAIALKHALRNALIPVLTLSGLQAVILFTGSVLVETVFSLDGLGSLVATAGAQRDYMLLQGTLAVFAIVSLSFGLIMDVVYYLLDPRIRY